MEGEILLIHAASGAQDSVLHCFSLLLLSTNTITPLHWL